MSLKKVLEQRTIGSAENIPQEVFNRVLIRLKDECPFFKHSTFMIATDRNGITIISENDEEQFESITLEMEYLRETMKVTTDLYHNNEEVETYLEEKIYAKVFEAMNTKFGKELASAPGTAVKVTDTLGLPMLLKMRKELKTSYLGQAVWVVDRTTYNTLMEMLIDNKPLVKSKINEKTGIVELEMLGHALYVVETISSNVKLAFVNLKRGFVVRMLNELSVKKLAEVGYTEGVQIYALETMFSGKVIETAAIVQGFYAGTENVEEEPVTMFVESEEIVEETKKVEEEEEKPAKKPARKSTKKAKEVK